MDSLHVIPGKGLSGQLFLGMSLTKAIHKFKNLSTKIPEVQVVEEIETKRIYLVVPECRLKLIFDNLYQKLIIIEIDCIETETPFIPIIYQSQVYTDYQEIVTMLDESYKSVILNENVCLESYQGISVVKDSNLITKILVHKGQALPDSNQSQILPKNNQFLIDVNNKIVVKYPNGKIVDLL